MRFDYLEEFITLARRRSFTAASKDLHVAQSTLSKHMSDLSKSTGLHLFDSVPQMRLTPTGIKFLEYAERIVHLKETAIAECRKIDNGSKGTLIIEDPIVLTSMTSEVNKLLDAFSADNPEISTGIRVNEMYTTIEAIDNGVFDIAQGIYLEKDLDSIQIGDREFELIPFMEDEAVLWVSKNHPLANKEPLLFTDLKDEEVYLPGSMVWLKWKNMLCAMSRKFGFELNVVSSVTDSINEYWSGNPEGRVYLLTGQITNELRVTARKEMVVRRFKDDTSFMFYHMFDAHSKNPSVALFEDWYFSTRE